MIEERKKAIDIHERNDLFSALLAVSLGSSKDDSDSQLSTDELLGTSVVMILGVKSMGSNFF